MTQKKCKTIYRCFQAFAIALILFLFASSNSMGQIEIKGINILLPHEEKLEKGTLKINTLPADAKVYINGNYEGKTPFEKSVLPGSYEVKVKKTNYGTVSRIVHVKSKGLVPENFKLYNRWHAIVIIPLVIGSIAVAAIMT